LKRKKNHYKTESLLNASTNLFVNLFLLLFPLLISSVGFAQTPQTSKNLLLRSNIQSNTAATTLRPSNKSPIKAQYVYGQTPLLGKVSVAGVEVRQGFIQPLTSYTRINNVPALSTSVYPNPFVDRIRIDFDATPSFDVHTSLFDMRGRLVTKKHFKNPTNRIELDLNQLANGKYMLVVNVGAQILTKHIIKHD